MRPKSAVWPNYLGPAQKHWMLGSKRGTRASVGPKILLAAVVAVAGMLGLRGIDPQAIDAGRMEDAPAHLPKMSLSTPTTKRSGIVAAIPLPPHRVLTVNEAAVSSPQPTVEPLAETGAPPAFAAIPDAQAKANTLRPEPAVKLTNRSRAAPVAKQAVMVRKKAIQVEHRNSSGAYVQNGGWSWQSSGWTGYSSFGNSRSF